MILSHGAVGEALLNAALSVVGNPTMPTRVVAVAPDDDPDGLRERALLALRELATDDGVLLLTDAYGSTPSNVACSLGGEQRLRVVAGVNLPMLVRVLNYSDLELDRLVETALAGGHAGIVDCQEC